MLFNDLRYTARLLRKSPLFTLAVVATLTLGIGATTAIFSVVNAVMLQPLPFAAPGRLMYVAEKNDKLNIATFGASALNFLSFQEKAHTFESMGAIGYASVNMTGQGDPEQLNAGTMTANVLPLVGVAPIAGRTFSADEDKPGGARVVMLDEAFWRRRFAADPAIAGKVIALNDANYQIIGVVPNGLSLINASDVWLPMAIDPGRERRLNHVISAIGRLKPGVTVAQAQADMDDVARRNGEENPEVKDWGVRLVTFDRWIVGDSLRTSLWMLLGAVACVLLIACANVANLLLGRAVAREREMAVRTALGAGRRRLLVQLLVESLTLSLLGGAGGLAFAQGAVRLMNAALPPNLLPVAAITISGPVLLFALAVTALTGLLFGVAPAWSMAKTQVGAVLKQSARGSTSGARGWLKNGLAAAELALATMLLAGAALLGQTLVRLQHVPLGFTPDHLLTFQLAPPVRRYPIDSGALQFYKDLLASLESVPGVTGAAVSSGLPMGQGNYTRTPVGPLGQSVMPVGASMPIDWRVVSASFFKTMGIPLLKGRLFNEADTPAAPLVMIVSQSMATHFWGDADPIGRMVHRVGDNKDIQVVGVVGDVRNNSLDTELPTMYYASTSRVWPRMDVVVRTMGDPSTALAAVRERVRALDPTLPVATVHTMEDFLSASAAQPRLNATLLGVFSFVALVVAAVGVYGVLAYSVGQRTREIGVRMALGAERGHVLRLIVREGMTVGLAGIALGIAGGLGLGRWLSSLVYGVPVRDPLTFTVVTVVLTLVALLACALPAYRASRVDPLIALQSD